MNLAFAWICIGLVAGGLVASDPAAAQIAKGDVVTPTDRPMPPRGEGRGRTAPVTPGTPPAPADTPSLQPVPPTGTLERIPPSGVLLPAPLTGDEHMEKPAPPTGPNSIPTAPDAASRPKPQPSPSAAPP